MLLSLFASFHRISSAGGARSTFKRLGSLHNRYIFKPSSKEKVESVLAAFQVYKEKYSDCKIRDRFTISHDDTTWPESTRGLKLGNIFTGIRSKGSFKSIHNELISLGYDIQTTPKPKQQLVTTVNNDDSILVTAAKTFAEFYNTTHVPIDFVVPSDEGADTWPLETNGLELGSIMDKMKHSGRLHKSAHKELEELGFIINVSREKLRLLEAVQIFYSIHDYKKIPPGFVVPSSQANGTRTEATATDIADDESQQWPEEFHGMKLGQEYYKIKTWKRDSYDSKILQKRLLNHTKKTPKLKYVDFLNALKTYKAIHGNLDIPDTFIVPSTADWSKSMHGTNMGELIAVIGAGTKYKRYKKELYELGLPAAAPKRRNFIFSEVFTTFQTYRKIHADLLVPNNHIIPSGDGRYPQTLWNKSLYTIWGNINRGRLFPTARHLLVPLGFPTERVAIKTMKNIKQKKKTRKKKVDSNGSNGMTHGTADGSEGGSILTDKERKIKNTKRKKFQRLHDALIIYKRLHGHVNIPLKFTVPYTDENYPKNLYGYTLGAILSAVLNGHRFRQFHSELREIGVIFNETKLALKPLKQSKGYKYERLMETLKIFKSIHGHVEPTRNYKIPHGDSRYNKSVWGTKFGTSIYNIQMGRAFKDKQKEFQEVGVEILPQKAVGEGKRKKRQSVGRKNNVTDGGDNTGSADDDGDNERDGGDGGEGEHKGL